MEINELKSIWDGANQNDPDEKKSMEEMRSMIKRKSNTTIEQAKKFLRIKAGIFFFIGMAVLLMMINVSFDPPQLYLWDSLSKDQFVVMMGSMGAVVLLVSVHMFYVVKNISHDQRQKSSLRLSLLGIKASIHKMMNVSIYSDAIGVPFFSTFFLYIQFFKNQSLVPDWRVVFLPFIAAFLFFIVREKMTYYQKNKYGHYLKGLDESLMEMRDIDEN